jgi:hypothetical protein
MKRERPHDPCGGDQIAPSGPTSKPEAQVHVAYLTTDEVNRDLAVRLVDACGVTLYLVTPHDLPPDGPVDAVLYDPDFLPVTLRQVILAAVAAGTVPHPAGVPSYSLDEDVVRTLRKHHVAVSRRLDAKLFRKLRSRYARRGRRCRATAAAPRCRARARRRRHLASPDLSACVPDDHSRVGTAEFLWNDAW